MSERFDVIPYTDLSSEDTWKCLGKGSFGAVYLATYLGLDVAVKEVANSTEYDMQKYLQREVKIMSEARHSNIVQYLGICIAPAPELLPPLPFEDANSAETQQTSNKRILIISEYLPCGNLRSFIHSTKPFPWRLRISFATDVARALAYLQARNCLHRDLKGENLLLTENNRLKMCDFGFARIAARNDEEMRRMSYCGTDGYMSPEIMIGEEFGLETDIFSMGIIFCEILSRKLADDDTFVRAAPDWALDKLEVYSLASSGCPQDFIKLAVDCCAVDPKKRPTFRNVLERLRVIEQEILHLDIKTNTVSSYHVGSMSFGGRSKAAKPAMPSFNGQVVIKPINPADHFSDSESDEEDELPHMESAHIGDGKSTNFKFSFGLGSKKSEAPAQLESAPDRKSRHSDYSTSVIRSSKIHTPKETTSSILSSILTVKGDNHSQPHSNITIKSPDTTPNATSKSNLGQLKEAWQTFGNGSQIIDRLGDALEEATITTPTKDSASNKSSTVSKADATGGHSMEASDISVIRDDPIVSPHRFTLVKPTFIAVIIASLPSPMSYYYGSPPSGESKQNIDLGRGAGGGPISRSEVDAIRTAAAKEAISGDMGEKTATKCGLCSKKYGFMKQYLQCDDCHFRCHVKCADYVVPDCGMAIPPELLPPPITQSAPSSRILGSSKLSKLRPTSLQA